MRSKNDWLDYLEHNALYHYGVLGMKWGVRKAYKYAKDTNQRQRNEAVRESRLNKNTGKITSEEHRANKKAANEALKRKNKEVKREIKANTPTKKKGTKAKSIYQPNKTKAYESIPKYGLKRGLRSGFRGIAGFSTATAALSVPIIALTAYGFSPAVVAGTVGGIAVSRIADHAIGETIFKKSM